MIFFILVSIVLFSSGAYMVYRGLTVETARKHFLLGSIPQFVGVMYNMAFALNIGSNLEVSEISYARYLGWMISVPIILLLMSFIAIEKPKERTGMILSVLGFGIIVVLSCFGAIYEDSILEFAWAGFAALLLAILIYVFYSIFSAEMISSPKIEKDFFRRVFFMFAFVWPLYLLVWLVANLPFFPTSLFSAMYSTLDLFVKGFFLIYLAEGVLAIKRLLKT